MNPSGSTPITENIQAARYGAVLQFLHWATALAVLVLLIMGKMGLVDVDHPTSATFMWHGSLGVLVLALVALRLLWRFVRPPPALPSRMGPLARVGARAMHATLYAMLIALPLSGWIAASSEGARVNFLNIATLPAWTGVSSGRAESAAAPRASSAREPVGEEREDLAEELHELLGDALIVLVSLHILAALKHELVDHDHLVRRMLPAPRRKSLGAGPGHG